MDFRTYTNAQGDPLEDVSDYDQNGIAVEERINMCQARGVCLELLRWWSTKYTTEGRYFTSHLLLEQAQAAALNGCSVVGGFTTHLLMTQAAALLKYKWCAQQDNRERAPGCTLFMLTRQIENVLFLIFPGDHPSATLQEWRKARNNISGRSDCDLGFSTQYWDHIIIVERQPPQSYGKHYSAETSTTRFNPFTEAPADFFSIGFTPFDRAVMEFSGAGVQEETRKKCVKT